METFARLILSVSHRELNYTISPCMWLDPHRHFVTPPPNTTIRGRVGILYFHRRIWGRLGGGRLEITSKATYNVPDYPSLLMTTPAISVRDLHKTYVVSQRESGVMAALQSLFHRQTEEIPAVAGISFELAPGEIVGFLGPNGAGKTTTLKMLSGLLHPTKGEATVLGHVPWKRDKDFLRQITLVMGQKQQLIWDLPAADSFLVNQAIYDIPAELYRARVGELTEMLGLSGLLNKQV